MYTLVLGADAPALLAAGSMMEAGTILCQSCLGFHTSPTGVLTGRSPRDCQPGPWPWASCPNLQANGRGDTVH